MAFQPSTWVPWENIACMDFSRTVVSFWSWLYTTVLSLLCFLKNCTVRKWTFAAMNYAVCKKKKKKNFCTGRLKTRSADNQIHLSFGGECMHGYMCFMWKLPNCSRNSCIDIIFIHLYFLVAFKVVCSLFPLLFPTNFRWFLFTSRPHELNFIYFLMSQLWEIKKSAQWCIFVFFVSAYLFDQYLCAQRV